MNLPRGMTDRRVLDRVVALLLPQPDYRRSPADQRW
jgi:hypothetical protein